MPLAVIVVCHGLAGLEWPTHPTLFTLAMYLRWGGLFLIMFSKLLQLFFLSGLVVATRWIFGAAVVEEQMSFTTRRPPAVGGFINLDFWRAPHIAHWLRRTLRLLLVSLAEVLLLLLDLSTHGGCFPGSAREAVARRALIFCWYQAGHSAVAKRFLCCGIHEAWLSFPSHVLAQL